MGTAITIVITCCDVFHCNVFHTFHNFSFLRLCIFYSGPLFFFICSFPQIHVTATSVFYEFLCPLFSKHHMHPLATVPTVALLCCDIGGWCPAARAPMVVAAATLERGLCVAMEIHWPRFVHCCAYQPVMPALEWPFLYVGGCYSATVACVSRLACVLCARALAAVPCVVPMAATDYQPTAAGWLWQWMIAAMRYCSTFVWLW